MAPCKRPTIRKSAARRKSYLLSGEGGSWSSFSGEMDALPGGLQSDSIWITQVDGGFNVVLGHDIRAKVDGVLEGCDKPNDQSGGSAVATITQVPNPTITLEGSVTPIVTAVTAAVDGFDKGDLAVILDKGLADRLNEFMDRTKDCQAGSDFDQQHSAPAPARKRAGGGTYDQALCASQAVMGGVQAEGPWNDLLLLNPAGVHFQFAQAAGPAMDAANQPQD
ncbi:hypothetical protein GE09DRAFT_1239220 [Coniochaeta sp. 2T2.1]|nr:hypothetical protein GE09DRAFT_1239220 [Coniochaeta sp. 2T2.1]